MYTIFKKTVIESFKRVKRDINSIKENTNSWTQYLHKKQNYQEAEIRELKCRIRLLEKRLNNEEIRF